MKSAAATACDGMILELAKSQKDDLIRDYEKLKKKHARHKAYQSEVDVILELIESTSKHKNEYIAKLVSIPQENTVIFDTFTGIVETLTTTNESLIQSLTDFKEAAVEVFTDEDLERETHKYENELKEINEGLAELRAKAKAKAKAKQST